MCGRFSVISNSKSLAEHFALVDAGEFIHSYNVSPSDVIPVVRLNNDQRELVTCHWGLVPHWARDTRLHPINAKAETIDKKPFFRSAYKHNRCLIPANEWKGSRGHKQPFYLRLADSELFAFAGLWDHWEQGDDVVESCTIITTNANELMAPIHNRMPVILDKNDYNEWLFDGTKSLLVPYHGNMTCHQVSTIVNNPDNEGRDLIQPVS